MAEQQQEPPREPLSAERLAEIISLAPQRNRMWNQAAFDDLLIEVDWLRAALAAEREEKWQLIRAYNERGEQLAARDEIVRAVAGMGASSLYWRDKARALLASTAARAEAAEPDSGGPA